MPNTRKNIFVFQEEQILFLFQKQKAVFIKNKQNNNLEVSLLFLFFPTHFCCLALGPFYSRALPAWPWQTPVPVTPGPEDAVQGLLCLPLPVSKP